ncbi:MAG: hypothetical protein LBR17_00125 [Bacteroidales bacterium]|jgi:hypothetical protein|nr:hypothetical protein [Bacteroidales bacterium]
MKRNVIIAAFICLLLISCKENVIQKFDIDFAEVSNTKTDTVSLTMDLEDAVTEGIVIPTKRQTNDGFFHFTATVKGSNKMYYKIYYQNESYKFENGDSLDTENFYGSWEETDTEFKPVPADGKIKDKFRIVGNPRNEKIYYGEDPVYQDYKQQIEKKITAIRNDKKWFEWIKTAAANNNISVEEQLYRDAAWVINLDKGKGNTNNRYKRNPRTGLYSFLLVVVDEQALKKLPRAVKNIALSDSINGFTNPYTYFLNGKGEQTKGISTLIASKHLKTKAVLSGKNGVFVDMLSYARRNATIYPNNGLVGDSDTLYYKAAFQQYFHSIAQDYFLHNIPVVEDILNNEYDNEQYKNALKIYADTNKRILDHPYISDYPGKTIKVNNGYISLINPGNKERMQNPRKESTGIKTRIGFTYGKFRGKIKFPAILNQTGVWSGLTNAFWLIYQSEQAWNKRRICNNSGYVTQEKNGQPDAKREATTNYSEIDIEIIKTGKYWGGGYDPVPENYNPFNKDEVILACTNWDLACPAPSKFFNGGGHHYNYLSKDYTYVRWYDTYRALTSREVISNQIFHNDYYYYEIEWRPNEIIWRIGATPDKMYVVGYMNDSFCVIPDNQMLAVVTQEWHYSEFWPPVVYDQNFLPYPKNDIEGRVYDIVVE